MEFENADFINELAFSKEKRTSTDELATDGGLGPAGCQQALEQGSLALYITLLNIGSLMQLSWLRTEPAAVPHASQDAGAFKSSQSILFFIQELKASLSPTARRDENTNSESRILF